MITPDMIARGAEELHDHRGMSYEDNWWCECGATGQAGSQGEADTAIASHMAERILRAALDGVS